MDNNPDDSADSQPTSKDAIGDPPPWQGAVKPSFALDNTADQAMAAIFTSGFDQWRANQAAAIDGRDPEGVHQMRVGLRRLRSALSIFKRLIPKSQLAWLQPGAKKTASTLGPARDWDVFLSDLLIPIIQVRPDDTALDSLRRGAEARRTAAYGKLRKDLAAAPYERFLLRVDRWLEAKAWRSEQTEKQATLSATPIATFASELLTERRAKALALGADFARLPAEDRHILRIAMKKLRYAVEFFAMLFERKAVKPFVGSLKALQDDLGHLNDVAVAESLMDDLIAHSTETDVRRPAGLVVGWHARGLADLEDSLLRDWSTFTKRRPFWT